MNLKRGAKAVALEWVARSGSFAPDATSSAALRLMKIGFGPTGTPPTYPGGVPSACCISVDFDVTREGRYQSNHIGTRLLLDLSEKYGVPLTWAICGKTAEEDREAYESILSSSVRQEVGIHTYSHIYANESTEDQYEADVRRCVSYLSLAPPPTTFVFPKNREGYFGMLRRLGFLSYRGARRAIGPPVANEGLWNIRPVYYVDQKSLGAESLIRHFVDACQARSAVFHLWTHPWSITTEGNPGTMAERTLDPVFAYLRDRRESGLMATSTMSEIAASMGEPGPVIGAGVKQELLN